MAVQRIGKKQIYVEPSEYFPKEIRKACKLGEYDPEYIAEQKAEKKKKNAAAKKASAKKTTTKKK